MLCTGFSSCWGLLFTCCFIQALDAGIIQQVVNDRPVIGVLTQMVSDAKMKPYGKTYIPASYVKYIESGGSRVMPIRLTHTKEQYETIFKKINGLLLIGGAVDLETSDFARVAKVFYKLALEANNAGDFFPIWGTCMGMQLLTALVAEKDLLTSTPAENLALPLDLTPEADTSRMFKDVPSELLLAMTKEPLTGNFHNFGIEVKNYNESTKLMNFFSVLSTNVAENGVRFLSTIEGKKYPFYGVQWHPEVNRFQWRVTSNFPHSQHAVQLSSLMAQFFVNEGRRNFHQFDNKGNDEELIYNYTPVYAGNFTGYQQVYFF